MYPEWVDNALVLLVVWAAYDLGKRHGKKLFGDKGDE